MGILVKLLALVFGVLTVGSFLGALHPLGDSLAVFRLPLACLFALAAIWTSWPKTLRWSLTGLGVLAMLSVLWWRWSDGLPGTAQVYQRNLYFARAEHGAVIADILDRRPDVVTLQEVTDRNRAVLDGIAADYPAQLHCPFARVGGPAVASRWPMVPDSARCIGGRGLAVMQVQSPLGPVWIGSLHLHWPWPHGQAKQRDVLLPELAKLEGPILLGGDFNMVPWSYTFASIAKATRTKRAGNVAPTLFKSGVPLPIDHVLGPNGGTAEVLPRLGSDHNGVLARVALMP